MGHIDALPGNGALLQQETVKSRPAQEQVTPPPEEAASREGQATPTSSTSPRLSTIRVSLGLFAPSGCPAQTKYQNATQKPRRQPTAYLLRGRSGTRPTLPPVHPRGRTPPVGRENWVWGLSSSLWLSICVGRVENAFKYQKRHPALGGHRSNSGG